MIQAIATHPIIDNAVLTLWNEGMMPEMIAGKLGYPLHMVEDIIEAPDQQDGFSKGDAG